MSDLTPDTGAPGHGPALKVRLSPAIREALASSQPGEDFDEALLRTLKARYPQHATDLLAAFTRLVEIEMQRAHEDKQQAVRRLAESDPGPEITMTSSGDGPLRTVTQTTVIRVGNKEYHSLEELPPDLRRAVEGRMPVRKSAVKIGCTSMLLGGWVVALLRLFGK